MEQLINYVKAYETYLRSLNKSPHTVKQYTLDAKQFTEITQKEQSINDALIYYSKIVQEIYHSINSVNRKYASTRFFLSFLQLRGAVGDYNIEKLQPLKKEEKKLQILNEKQTASVLSFWPHKYDIAQNKEDEWLALRNATIIFVIAELGIKPSELIRMEWKHVHEEQQQLVVLSAKKFRVLPLSTKLIELLHRYKEGTLQFLPDSNKTPYIWLGVGNRRGEPITVKTIERIFLAMSEQLTVKVTATNLRYYVINREIQQTEEDEALYEQFGYARKGVLTERHQRFPKNETN